MCVGFLPENKMPTLKKQLEALRNTLSTNLIERDVAIRLAFLSVLAGEHFLLIGQPGTAKSILARRLHLAFRDGQYFERLLTRFSVPEELFGPLSIKALENDRYERITQGYLPTASLAFIDEIFKANSAILNALLTVLNEREFDNGDQRVKIPLLAVIGASNELPEEAELAALYDRFLCRYQVQGVSAERFIDLLQLPETAITPPDDDLRLDPDNIISIQQQAEKLALPDNVLQLLEALHGFLQQQNISVSDRRWRKAVKLLKVSAYTNGQDTVSIWDCWLLQHCLWEQPKQRQAIADWYVAHVGIGSGFNHHRLEKLVKTWELTLKTDTHSQTQQRNANDEPLYQDDQGQTTSLKQQTILGQRNGEALYLAPPDVKDGQGYSKQELRQQFFDDTYEQCHINGQWVHLNQYVQQQANRLVQVQEHTPLMAPISHPESFINSRVQDITLLHDELLTLYAALEQQHASLDHNLGEHLWVMSSFMENAANSLAESMQAAKSLTKRLHTVLVSYQTLAS